MTGSAFGKVILLGEHAVVYGVPAVVVGIDRGATARVVPNDGAAKARPSELVLAAGDGEKNQARISVDTEDPTDLGRAFRALLDVCGVKSTVTVEVATDLPAAAGLAS